MYGVLKRAILNIFEFKKHWNKFVKIRTDIGGKKTNKQINKQTNVKCHFNILIFIIKLFGLRVF